MIGFVPLVLYKFEWHCGATLLHLGGCEGLSCDSKLRGDEGCLQSLIALQLTPG